MRKKICKSEKCKKCYYACESCGRIKDDFYEMTMSTHAGYEWMVYASVIDINKIKENGTLEIKNINEALCDPTYDVSYVSCVDIVKHNENIF